MQQSLFTKLKMTSIFDLFLKGDVKIHKNQQNTITGTDILQ